MIRICTLKFMLLFCSVACAQEFKWDLYLNEVFEGTATIRGHYSSGKSASEILNDLPDGIYVRGISVNLYNDNLALPLHAELVKTLKSCCPIVLANALKSSGNMHNPALEPLREPLSKAIVSSSVVKPLIDLLKSEGYIISEVHLEKLRIFNEDLIQAGVYIELQNNS